MTTLDRESIDATQHTPPRAAALDSAHVGDIEGALGRIRLSDNDAGGVATYAATWSPGQSYW